MWRNSFMLKGVVIFGLFVVLMVPLAMINGQVSERQGMSRMVADEIAATYSRAQTVSGPAILVLYRERTWRRIWNKEQQAYEQQPEFDSRRLVLFPQTVRMEAQIDTERRYRGIYSAPVYQSDLMVQGQFRIPERLPVEGKDVLLDAAYLMISVDDMRGVQRVPEITIADNEARRMGFGPDSGVLGASSLYVDLGPASELAGRSLPFRFSLQLNGTERFGVIPAADDFALSVDADWPHPGFHGLMLPRQHHIEETGFRAQWSANRIAASAALSCMKREPHCDDTALALNVDLKEPVTGYTSVQRAVKYSELFILLSFAAFLLFEVLRRISIHGIQYLLVGMSLAMFYLLLLALSEHLAFALAYLVSAGSCVGLIGFYLRYVLGSWKAALAFSASLSLVYGVLYVALLSEDYALLLGAGLLFLVLAVIMVATRKVDWDGYGQSLKERLG